MRLRPKLIAKAGTAGLMSAVYPRELTNLCVMKIHKYDHKPMCTKGNGNMETGTNNHEGNHEGHPGRETPPHSEWQHMRNALSEWQRMRNLLVERNERPPDTMRLRPKLLGADKAPLAKAGTAGLMGTWAYTNQI